MSYTTALYPLEGPALNERPEALLKSALEKIVYFEARSEQQAADLAALREEVERGKRELAAASQREIALRRQVAELEVQLQRSHAELHELGRVNDVLRSERAHSLGKLLEMSAIEKSDGSEDSDGLDLAQFISELRSEVLTLRAKTHEPERAAPVASSPAPSLRTSSAPVSASSASLASEPEPMRIAAVALPPPMPSAPRASPVAAHAARLQQQGRLAVSVQEVESLSRQGAPMQGKSEETLFGFSVRELAAPDAQARVRAAERLKAIGHAAAAPVLATALHGEDVPEVQVALLAAFAELAGPEGAKVVAPLLQSPSPEVRMGALKAALKLEPGEAAPHLAAAVRDPDPQVRRRASLLALGLDPEAAQKLGEQGLHDEDAEVRSLSALVLGAGFGEKSRALLLEALCDSDRKVRHSAAQSLSRLLGEDVSALVDLGEAQRRREARRLATKPLAPRASAPTRREPEGSARIGSHGAATSSARSPVASPAAADPRGPQPASNLGHARTTQAAELRSPQAASSAAHARTPHVEGTRALHGATFGRTGEPAPSAHRPAPAAPAARSSDEALCSALLVELRSAIRGKALPELCEAVGSSPPVVEQACELLVARGQALRRGLKYFQA